MRYTLTLIFLVHVSFFSKAQNSVFDWYSESNTNGILIQNSYNKGGPYKRPVTNHFNPSYLVYFTRVENKTDKAFKLDINFENESFGIPNSPNTFVKLFLPSQTMTLDKQSYFSYGFTHLDSLNKSTQFQKTLQPNEACCFYVVAIFYQNKESASNEDRGGNRGELLLKGKALYYNLLPQVESLPCGRIIFEN